MTYAWTVYATMTAIVLAVMGLLGTALFQLVARLDRMWERIDRRFEQVDQRFEQVDQRFDQVDERFAQVDQRFDQVDKRFDAVDQRMRDDKAELLGRLDVLAERITRLEAS